MKLLLTISFIFSTTIVPSAMAQGVPYATWQVEAGYNYVHTNAPPAGCGCLSMNGGAASVVRQFNPKFGVDAQFTGETNGNVNATGRSLTLFSYVGGPRYSFLPSNKRFNPFAEILLGASHAGGGLYASGGSSSGTANAFAMSTGGGVDVTLTQHLALRLVQADYLLTLLPNGVNSRQNNINLSTGIVFRFAKR